MTSTKIAEILDSRGINYNTADLNLLVLVTSPKVKRQRVFPAQYSSLDDAIKDLLSPEAIRSWLTVVHA